MMRRVPSMVLAVVVALSIPAALAAKADAMAAKAAKAAKAEVAAKSGEDPQLAGIRSLAERMLKEKTAGGDSAFCEYAPITQVDGCSGPKRNAIRHRIARKGLIETWVYRSPRESGDPIGYYRARLDEKQWRGLLRSIAAMQATGNPPGMPPPPPPGPMESIPVLTLSDGRTTAEFGTAGPASGSIGDAFSQPARLARGARDTVWQLALVNPKAEIRKDSVHFSAEWKWLGPPGARILFARPSDGDFCGTAAFKWFLDTSEFAVDWHRGTASPGRGRDLIWELPGGKPAMLSLAFAYDGPKGKPEAKRIAMLDGIGIRLVPGGSRDTVSATVFTERFEF